MPTYEYRCSKGHEFEQFQRMSEDPLRVCTVCGAPAERILSAGTGLLFKGSGFYITDYRSDAYRKAADADSGKPAKEAAPKDGASKDVPPKDAAPKDAAPKAGAPKESGSRPAGDSAPRDSGGSSGSASSKGD